MTSVKKALLAFFIVIVLVSMVVPFALLSQVGR